MKGVTNMLKKIIPNYSIKWLTMIIIVNTIAYNGSRLITSGKKHYNASLWIDSQIPMINWMIVIYLGCYIFWIVNYILAVREDKETARNFALSDMFAKMICFIIYVVFPTTMRRPDIVGTGIFDNIINFVYQVDPADNLFPSLHCLASWICYLGVKDLKSVPRWYKNASMIMAILVFISTLTVKQHVLIDVVGGVLIAEVCYSLCHMHDIVYNIKFKGRKKSVCFHKHLPRISL